MATLQNLNFVPTSIAGCQLWLDANDRSTLSLSGTSVTQWNDKSGNGNNALGSNSPVYSEKSLNSLNTIQLRGSNDYFYVANNFTYSTYPYFNIFVLFQPNNATQPANAGVISTDTPGSFGRSLAVSGNFFQQEYYSGFSNLTTFSASTWYVTDLLFTSNTSSAFYVNGTAYAAVTTNSGTNTRGLLIGVQNNTGSYITFNANIDVAEILIYTTNITTFQREQVEGYLAWKWGLVSSLPSSHPYKLIAPNSAGLGYPSALTIPLPLQSLTLSSSPLIFFNPTSIGNCQVWLDANEANTLTFSGSSVTQWRDRSTNAYIISTTSGTVTRVSVSRFFYINLASGAIMTSPTITFTSGQSSIFIVAQPTLGAGAGINMLFARSGVDYSIRFGNDFKLANPGNSADIGNGGAFIINGTSITTSNPALNTQLNIIYTPIDQSFTSAFTLSTSFLSRFFTGYIAEVLIYSSPPSTANRQLIEGYLAWKWGISNSLPASHPYKNIVPGPSNLPISMTSLASASFRPTQISGCQLWLDGQDPFGSGTTPTVGSTVGIWSDKSGNGKNATASGTPTYLSGGGISFNGTSYYINTNFAYNLSTRSIFIILKVNSYLQFAGILPLIPNPSSGSDQATTSGLSVETATSSAVLFNGNQPGYSSSLTATITNMNLYNDNMNGTAGSGFVNGTQATNVTATYTAGTTSGFGLGARWQAGVMTTLYGLTGIIYEVLLYSGPVTSGQRQAVEGYLAWKWGLVGSLPSNHPFKQFPPPPS